MSADKDGKQIAELTEKLVVFQEKANSEAKRSLDLLRRNNLDRLAATPFVPALTGYDTMAALPTQTVAAVNFRSEIDVDRLRQETTEAMRAWIVAAAMTDNPLLFMVESKNGMEVRLRLGMGNSRGKPPTAAGVGLTERLFAAFPGLRLNHVETDKPIDSVANLGGRALLTGIPLVRNEGEIQTFPVDRLIRGMRGRPFALVVIARPLDREKLEARLNDCRQRISSNHEQIHRTFSRELGLSEGITKGITAGGTAMVMQMAMTAITAGVSAGIGLPFFGQVGASLARTAGSMAGSTFGGNLGGHVDRNKTRSRSASSSMEQLDAFAEAYEEALREESERIVLAQSQGGWETSAHVFARNDEEARWVGALVAQGLTGDREAYEPFRVLAVRMKPAQTSLGFWEKPDRTNGAIPLFSFLTSSELAAFTGLPMESHPGLEVRRIPRFFVQPVRSTAPGQSDNTIPIGGLLDRDVELPGPGFGVRENELASHLLVAGITGSGKSTTLRTILGALDAPFLVIEPAKTEYRRLTIKGQPIRVYTAGDERTAPFRLNPFEIPPDTPLHTHMDALSALFNTAFPMEGPMAALVEQGLWTTYEQVGWDVNLGVPASGDDPARLDLPTMDQYYQAMETLIGEQGYAGDYGANIRGALLTRLRSLCGGPRGALFNTGDRCQMKRLVDRPTVIEMNAIGSDETKVFLAGLLLWRLYRHFECEAKTMSVQSLRALVVVEEAHRLFKRAIDNSGSLTATNTRSHSVELFENILAESRSYGLGVAIVDQLPLRLSDGAIKNTATKIIHRLSARDDAEEMGGAMGISAEDSLQLTRLRVGEALVHRADMEAPAHVRVQSAGGDAASSEDGDVRRRAEKGGYLLTLVKPPGFDGLVKKLEEHQPDALLRLGQNIFLTLLCGEPTELPALWNLAAADVCRFAKEIHEAIPIETGQAIARHAALCALQRRNYLRRELDWNDEVQSAWRALHVEDRVSIRNFRKAVLRESKLGINAPPPWVSDCHLTAARFWAEARQQAAAMCLEQPDLLTGGIDDEVEWNGIRAALKRQLLLQAVADFLANFEAAVSGVLQESRAPNQKFDGKRFERALAFFKNAR